MIKDIKKELFELRDVGYKAFTLKLIPHLDEKRCIGIRIPALKKYAKDVFGSREAEVFLNELPHFYFEENNLQSFLIMQIKDFEKCVYEVDRFLPYVDNWGTCDSLRPKVFSKSRKELIPYIEKWIRSNHVYTVRFGVQMLMVHFLDDLFDVKYLEKVSKIKSEEYYVNMMIAWYFATALAKQYEQTLPFLIERRLDKRVHNKIISKSNDSFRITKEQKIYLKSLRM